MKIIINRLIYTLFGMYLMLGICNISKELLTAPIIVSLVFITLALTLNIQEDIKLYKTNKK